MSTQNITIVKDMTVKVEMYAGVNSLETIDCFGLVTNLADFGAIEPMWWVDVTRDNLDIETMLICESDLVKWNSPKPAPPKCTCGAEALNYVNTGHSSWCDKGGTK